MATKKATIIIDVDDKSLQDLNQEIQQLEQSMQGLKVGTQEWIKQNQQLGKLKTQFQEATREAQKMQAVVEKVGSAEQIRSVAKLGSGLVGGFTAASGAVRLLGIESQVFDEMTARATTLMSVMGGLNQVADLFSKETLKGLSGVGRGFGQLVRTVKTSSLAMKTALISTGIGALVVGITLLIANWDKLSKAIGRNNAERKKTKELEESRKSIEVGKEKLSLAEAELKAIKDLAALRKDDAGELNAELKVLQERRMQSYNERRLAELELQATLDKLSKKRRMLTTEETQKIELQRDAVSSLTAEYELLEEEILQTQKTIALSDKIEEFADSINDLENAITKYSAANFSEEQVYQKQIALLNVKIDLIKLSAEVSGKLSKEEERQVKALQAQKAALTIQNNLRKSQLEIDIELLKNEITRNRFIDDYNQKVNDANRFLREQFNIEKDRQDLLENNLALIELDLEGIRKGRELRDGIVNFDLKRNKILSERLTQLYPSELKVTNEIYEQISRFLEKYGEFNELESFDFFKEKVESLTEGFKANLTSQFALNKEYEKQTKFGKQLIDDAAQDLAIKQITADFQVKSIGEQISAVQKQRISLGSLEEQYGRITSELVAQQRLIDNRIVEATKSLEGKNLEEQYIILQEISKLENDRANLQNQINQGFNDIADVQQEQLNLGKQLLDLEYARGEAIASVGIAESEITQSLEDQLRISAQLQSFVEQYNEEIMVSQQLLAQSIEFIAALQDRKAENAQKRIDDYQKQLNKLMKEEDDRASRLAEYEEELKDANGERYDELLALIEQEKEAQIAADADVENSRAAIEAKIKDEENKKLAAEARAAKWRKAQALIDAVIQGALGVIKALPNVFLAVATGVLAAAGVATIAAQKTPPIPEGYEEGGFTPKTASNKTPVGIVHGNEYVAPAFVTKSPQAQPHIAALEAQRLRGYAEGGFVAPDLGSAGQQMIDYDKMASAFLEAVNKLPVPEVSVVKISQSQREIALTKVGAGMRR